MKNLSGLGLLAGAVLLAACSTPGTSDPTLAKYKGLPTTADRPGDPPQVRLQDDQNHDPFNQRFCPPDVQSRGNC